MVKQYYGHFCNIELQYTEILTLCAEGMEFPRLLAKRGLFLQEGTDVSILLRFLF